MIVTLTTEQYQQAVSVARKRQAAAIKKHRPSAHGYDERNPLGIHLQGAVAELAVSLVTKLPWHDYLEVLTGDKKPPDVGSNIQVRSTQYENGHLLVHESDSAEDIFFLAVVKNRDVSIKGWISGNAAKSKKFWGDKFGTKRPAYWVPQTALFPFRTMEESE